MVARWIELNYYDFNGMISVFRFYKDHMVLSHCFCVNISFIQIYGLQLLQM